MQKFYVNFILLDPMSQLLRLNKALWLDIQSHVTIFNQSVCIIKQSYLLMTSRQGAIIDS